LGGGRAGGGWQDEEEGLCAPGMLEDLVEREPVLGLDNEDLGKEVAGQRRHGGREVKLGVHLVLDVSEGKAA